jgi:hypothetical protein
LSRWPIFFLSARIEEVTPALELEVDGAQFGMREKLMGEQGHGGSYSHDLSIG